MDTTIENLSCKRSSGRKRAASNNMIVSLSKRKSMRSQLSISQYVPKEAVGLNCFINLPPDLFTLTYLESNESNPNSLDALDCLKKKKWQAYQAGVLYNFSYKSKEIESFVRELNSAMRVNFQHIDPNTKYSCEMTVLENLNPTDNDKQALQIKVTKQTETKETLVYKGILLSWCNLVEDSRTLLPLLLCRGPLIYRSIVHNVLMNQFSLRVIKLNLTQEDFSHLPIYCLIMLQENDGYEATFTYQIPPGKIKLSIAVEHLLCLWKRIHTSESIEVELEEILLFNKALDEFHEATFGLKLGYTHLIEVKVPRSFSIGVNALVWFDSTKIIHVILKYFTYYIATHKLKLSSDLSTVSPSRLQLTAK